MIVLPRLKIYVKGFLSSSNIYMIPNLVMSIWIPAFNFLCKFLSPAEYGVVELVIVLFNLLNIVLP